MLKSIRHTVFRIIPGAVALATAALTGGCADPIDQSGPVAITVSPATVVLEDVAETAQLTATVTGENGETLTDVEIRWLVSDDAIASVSPKGLVRSKEEGMTSVWVFVDRLADTAAVTVKLGTRGALIRFYDALSGSDWDTDTNWGTTQPLDDWHGVTADAQGKVTRLSLSNNDLNGVIPPEIGMLVGLVELNLSGNASLKGSMPPELGNLVNLTSLNLSSTALSGSMPPELGNLVNLTEILLSSPFLSPGTLTGAIPPELGNLVNLEVLDLAGNSLGSSLPPELGNLTSLRQLSIQSNGLSGPIPPEFGNLQSLRSLQANSNPLDGRLPSDLTRLTLTRFHWNQTNLCAPTDDAFKEWLESINDNNGNIDCSDDT